MRKAGRKSANDGMWFLFLPGAITSLSWGLSPEPMSADSDNAKKPAAAATWNTELDCELRQMAARHLARLPPGQTLQATALVHEAWLRL